MEIPELALELEHGTLGGKFTTIEGLLTNVKEQLSSSGSVGVIGFVGDSSTQEQRTKLQAFIHKLDQVKRQCSFFQRVGLEYFMFKDQLIVDLLPPIVLLIFLAITIFALWNTNG